MDKLIINLNKDGGDAKVIAGNMFKIETKKDVNFCSKTGDILVKGKDISMDGKVSADGLEVAMKDSEVGPALPISACIHTLLAGTIQPPGSPVPVPISNIPMYAIEIKGKLDNKLSQHVKGKNEVAVAGSEATLENHPSDMASEPSQLNNKHPVELAVHQIIQKQNLQFVMFKYIPTPTYGKGRVNQLGGARTVYSEGKLMAAVGSYVDTCCDLGTPMQGKITKSGQ